jgi:hypothetical protein
MAFSPRGLSRRHLLASSAGVAGMGMLGLKPGVARALDGSGLKFLFVVNYGGWDPTRVFATEFANPFVDMERWAGLETFGDLSFVDHADRPSVRSFFESWATRSVIFNGVLVQSIAHENCLRIMMTGSTARDRSDWGAILGGAQASGFALPQVVVGGPSFPGAYGTFVTRTGTGGQLQSLLDGTLLDWSDVPVDLPEKRVQARIDAYVAGRVAAEQARVSGAGNSAAMLEAMARSHERAVDLEELAQLIDWGDVATFSGQAGLAAELLSRGLSRVATLGFSGQGWDSHANNDTVQSANFESLFAGLGSIMETLSALPGETTTRLVDETVVVVLSEMGRTPQLNVSDGKDHWPYTSTLVVGPGLAGGRVVGGYDSYYYGRPIDPLSGELSDSGVLLTSEVVGATLLASADIDPEEHTPGVATIDALLA